MKKLIFILALSLLLSSVNFGQTRKARPVGKPAVKTTSAPKSKPVVKREPEASAEEPKIVGLTVERYVNNIEVNSDGTSVETLEMLQRFQSEAAIEGLSKFERVFNGDLETAEVLETYILKADGKKITLPPTASFIKPTPQAEAAPSFSSLKMIEIKFDGLEKGDAAYFKIRLKTVKPMFGNHFDTLEILPAIYEWKSAEINLTAPADYPIYAQAVDFEGGKLPVENGKQRWQWRKNNLPAREIETGMYDWLSFSPRVAVTSFKNFEELGAAFWAEA
ncbi:MAG TPA: DUF3857 domain-containing protein, partial [Pyrinomonadaceae bacterium]|nr:DUF3857 domain-containing protein [Pyrinomonadaceae bacterium]